jgi:hypothetical protein
MTGARVDQITGGIYRISIWSPEAESMMVLEENTSSLFLEEPFGYRGLLFGRAIGAQQAPGR